jgi:hypothetical protein
MKSNQAIRKMLILSVFTLTLFGCTYSRTSWGDWNSWGEWKQTGNSEHQMVQVTSNPAGAEIYVDGNLIGTTPATINFNYPIVKSERIKYQYETKVPGVLEHFLLAQQTTTSKVSSEKEEQFKTASKSYAVEIRKEGYLPGKAVVKIPGNNHLTLTLREKPVFAIRKITVTNNFKLTLAEKVYETLYGKRYSVNTNRFENVKRQAFSSEAFDNPFGKSPDYYLEGEVDIQRGTTEITLMLTNREGKIITTKTATIETKKPETLPERIENLIRAITEKYLQ